MIEKPDVLLIDLTPLTDSLKNFKNHPIMEIKLIQDDERQQATLDVVVVPWSEGLKATYPMGQIFLKNNLIDNVLYKNVKITARFNFIITKDVSSNLLEVVPLAVDVSPLSPVVVLDRHSVEENQVIMFSDRLLLNYDLVILDDSTLIITNLVSNLAKSLIITQTGVPLLSIIINNYNDSRMRSLTLTF
uniref:Uncharacterized protein n=1 Tax=Romanomermis culicivorax TaxID=13658 RepID=A0A915JQB5_ROMCU